MEQELADDVLEKHVIDTFPYPIAVNLAQARSARQRRDSFGEFVNLLVTTEALVRFLGAALLLDLVSCESVARRKERLERATATTRDLDRPTIGTWMHVIDSTSKVLVEEGGGFFGAHDDAWSALKRPFRALLGIRNAAEHPKIPASEVAAQQHLGDLRRHLRRALDVVRFLADYRLVLVGPTEKGVGRFRSLLTVLRGATMPLEGRWLVLDRWPEDEGILLLSPDSKEYICLTPFFVVARSQDNADRVWAYTGADETTSSPRYAIVDRVSDQRLRLQKTGVDLPMVFLRNVAAVASHRVRSSLPLSPAAREDLAWDVAPPKGLASAVGVQEVSRLPGGASPCFVGVLGAAARGGGLVLRGGLHEVARGQQVVIKMARGDAGGSARARLEREYDLLSRIDHPHVTRAHALIRDEDDFYLVLPYVDGVTLSDLLRDREASGRAPPLSETEAEAVARQVVEAMAAVHLEGAHGDLKPANVIWGDSDKPAQITVIDLGAGEIDESASTELMTAFGTRGYVAPERFVPWPDQEWDARRADVYSLGVLIYQLFTGTLPPHDEERNISVSAMQAPRRWRILVRWCGQHDPSARPPSAIECLAFLDKHVEAPEAVASTVEYRSAVHQGIDAAAVSCLFIAGLVPFMAVLQGRPEYLVLWAATGVVVVWDKLRAQRSRTTRFGEQTATKKKSEPGKSETLDVLGLLRALAPILGGVAGLVVTFFILWVVSNEPFGALGLSQAGVAAAHLGFALALVAAWFGLRQLQRGWD